MPPQGSGPNMVSREKRASGDVFIGTGLLANTPELRSWCEASQLNDLVFLDMEEPYSQGSPGSPAMCEPPCHWLSSAASTARLPR